MKWVRMSDKKSKENYGIEKFMNNFINENTEKKKLTKIEKDYIKYSEKFKKKFGRYPYIAEPSGTMKLAIKAIKICLKDNKDILDEIYYPDKSNIY